MNLKDFSFTKEWTLFLDRDGVISRRLPGDYVRAWEEFRFIDGVLEAMAVFGKVFGRVIIASNQQGVGKKIVRRILDELKDTSLISKHLNNSEDMVIESTEELINSTKKLTNLKNELDKLIKSCQELK